LLELRRRLVSARTAGQPFAAAWPQALDATLGGLAAAAERRSWRKALDATSGSWEAAYAGRVVEQERALVALFDDEREPTADQPCEVCGAEVLGAGARFCGTACRVAWNRGKRVSRAA
jgi:hypothetical protein